MEDVHLHSPSSLRSNWLGWPCCLFLSETCGSSELLCFLVIIIIIIMAGMAVFYAAGYLIEERRRWPVITASPRGQCSK